MKDEGRTRCEIWTRVMGYHRPLSHFNPGKKAEFEERKCFKEPSFGVEQQTDDERSLQRTLAASNRDHADSCYQRYVGEL